MDMTQQQSTQGTPQTLVVQDGGLRPFWLLKEKLLSGAGPNSQGHSVCSWQASSSSSSLLQPGTGRSLDAVQDLALHAVLDLSPPHHQLQHLVDGMFWVFLQEGRAGQDEPAWNSRQELSRNLQPWLKPG